MDDADVTGSREYAASYFNSSCPIAVVIERRELADCGCRWWPY